MTIKRDDRTFELTKQELQFAHEEWRLMCAIEDAETVCEELGITLSKAELEDAARISLHELDKSDVYYETYFDTFRDIIPAIKKHKKGE